MQDNAEQPRIPMYRLRFLMLGVWAIVCYGLGYYMGSSYQAPYAALGAIMVSFLTTILMSLVRVRVQHTRAPSTGKEQE